MPPPPTYTTWKITCSSQDQARPLLDWLAGRIDLDRVVTDTVRAAPNGVEQSETVSHRLGDYFIEIAIRRDHSNPNPCSFHLVFQPLAQAGRFWKDLMVNVLQEIEEKGSAQVKLESKGPVLAPSVP
ncbi:MAG: hypothetical protein U0793_09610 [Gemmataceae bacterium]